MPAARLGLHALQCKSPSHVVGEVDFDLFSLTHDNLQSGWKYEYAVDPEILRINPSRGLDQAQTPVYVAGTHFINSTSLACAFGNIRASATFISNTSLLCVAPVYSGAVFDNLTVELRVTANVRGRELI